MYEKKFAVRFQLQSAHRKEEDRMKTIGYDGEGGIHIPAAGTGLNQNIAQNITRQQGPYVMRRVTDRVYYVSTWRQSITRLSGYVDSTRTQLIFLPKYDF